MTKFDEKNATPEELWEYCMEEYRNPNIIVKYLLEKFFEKIKRLAAKMENVNNILEVGCGAGESSRRIGALFEGKNFEVSEYDGRYITKLRETGFPYKIRQESVYELKREDNAFDCIFLLEVLEHLEDVETALAELFRVSGRYVIISVPHEPWWCLSNLLRLKYVRHWGNTPGHIGHWSPRKLIKLVKKYGNILEVRKSFPWIILMATVARAKT
jgi:ubiquinone/menaquinone biosynthesis C-methylase UbiE